MGASERRILHGDVAEALEILYVDHTDEIAVQLARHYQESGNDEKAMAYLIHAGDAAFRVYAHTEAIAHYTQALALDVTDSAMRQHFYLHGRLGATYANRTASG